MQKNGNFKRMLITLILKLNNSNAIAPSNENLIGGTTINDKVKHHAKYVNRVNTRYQVRSHLMYQPYIHIG